jgi:light-regulated signal transduction histidine kinase (bacteriophytochrome)
LIKDESKVNKQIDLDELSYIISHDLQEPLRMVTSYMQLLNKRYGDKLDDNAREYIKYAVDGSNRLKQMMDDLLTYSRIGRPGLNIENVNPENIILQVKKLLKDKHNGNNFTINANLGNVQEIKGDRSLLTKLFFNILDNSLKFNHSLKQVIEIDVHEESEEWIFSVRDNGLGIGKEYHSKVFGIFQKLHNHSEYPGSGIGLAICEKIVRRHNGRIWIDDNTNEGTKIFISIQKEYRAKEKNIID